MEILLVTLLLIVTMVLLIGEWIAIDLIAIGLMVALMMTRILTPAEAVSGFANPAVITVGAMFLISQAMIRTGVVSLIGRSVVALAGGRAKTALMIVLVTAGVASAFINNTPVVVLFMPMILSMGCTFGISPSKYLIPMCFTASLTGMCTLIGTSTNIIVGNLASRYGYGGFTMFELGQAGVPIAIAGFLLIVGVGLRLMPNIQNPSCELDGKRNRRYLSELSIPPGSRLVGLNPCGDWSAKHPGLEVLKLVRQSHIFHPCRDPATIAADDLLLVKGSPNDLTHILQSKDVELPAWGKGLGPTGASQIMVVELIIPPQSDLIGQLLQETHLARDEDLHIVAIERSGLHYSEKQIKDIPLRLGDTLLVWCRVDRVDRFRGRSDWILVEDVHHEIVHKSKAPLAASLFGLMVAAASFGLADIMVCALATVFLMVVTGCLPLRDAYRALQGELLLLIAGTIALSMAMDKSGASSYFAGHFLSLFDGASPVVVLGAILLVTCIVTELMSNNTAAVLMLPIAISTALSLGVNPKPFIVAVCLGASASFATPIGYQTNLMVYGPGGYRFSDYLKLGIPLDLLVIVGATLLIPIFWPL
ncbi:MAG: SLC13 family permease [Desulfobacterales bacterium]|nr:SLC13 family permease [Desulfobacterales bacterium]